MHCPDNATHRAADPHAAAHTGDAARRGVALLSEGRCPACPTNTLTPTTITLYGRSHPVASCPCCAATWELDGETYVLHDRGRLVE